MNYKRLEKNLIDNIKEAQIKLGYESRPISFNYTASSLYNLLGRDCSEEILKGFIECVRTTLSELSCREIDDGWCFIVPSEGTSYVNSLGGYDFLKKLISVIRKHDTTMEDVLEVFREYGNIVVEEIHNEEFDLLVYFEDGKPDDYYYCLTDEGCHISYHRFTKEDYIDLNF